MNKYIIFIISLLFPVFSYAQGTGGIKAFLAGVMDLINLSVPIVFGLALLFFFYGVGEYIRKSDNEAERKKGKDFMIWGVVAIFVMFSIWGLIIFLQQSFGLDANEVNGGKSVIFWDVRDKLK